MGLDDLLDSGFLGVILLVVGLLRDGVDDGFVDGFTDGLDDDFETFC